LTENLMVSLHFPSRKVLSK